MTAIGEKLVGLGRICGIYGTQGWVKVYSYTEPRGNIFNFPDWILEQAGARRRVEVESSATQGKSLLAKVRGVEDRDAARALIGAEVAVERAMLPACQPGEYYWTDLEGLSVRSVSGEPLGVVDHLLATGAHDVLVLAGADRRMIPFVVGEVVREVDLDGRTILVDWDSSYWEG